MTKPDFAVTFVYRADKWRSPDINTYLVARSSVASRLWELRKGGTKHPIRAAQGVYAVLLNDVGKSVYFHEADANPASFI